MRFTVGYWVSVIYVCLVSNNLIVLSPTYTRSRNPNADRVNHKPIITNLPQNATVELGGTFTMACKVLSDLHSNLQWLFERQNPPLSGKNATKLKVMV